MQLPPTLSGIGSDDEDDDAGGGSAAPLNMPGMLALAGSDDEDESPAAKQQPPKEDLSKTGAFLLSQSGAFKVSDFLIRPEGGLMSTIEEAADIKHELYVVQRRTPCEMVSFQATKSE